MRLLLWIEVAFLPLLFLLILLAMALGTALPSDGWIALSSSQEAAGESEILLLDVRSGQMVNLSKHPGGDYMPTWSADGHYLAFASNRLNNGAQYTLYMMDADGHHAHPVSTDTSFTFSALQNQFWQWSPQGAQLVFSLAPRGGNRDIFLADVAQGTLQNLTDHPADDGEVSWSPDGRQIVFASNRDQRSAGDIYIMTVDSGEVRRLTEHPALDTAPIWSPAGNVIAFISSRFGPPEVLSVGVADGALQRYAAGLSLSGDNNFLLVGNPYQVYPPVWSPDGEKLLYKVWSDEAGILVSRSVIVDALSHDLHNLIPVLEETSNPAWSPDGRRVAFLMHRELSSQLFVVPASGGPMRQLTDLPPEDVPGDPIWSPDGRFIAFKLYSVPPISPFSSALILTPWLCVLDAATGELRLRIPLPSTETSALAWRPE